MKVKCSLCGELITENINLLSLLFSNVRFYMVSEEMMSGLCLSV